MGLLVSSDTPVQTVQEFVKLAKTNPGKLTYASPGNGTPMHMAMELFKLESGTAILHIPYKEYSVSVADLIGGRINGMITAISVSGPLFQQVKTGKVKLIATLTNERLTSMTSVPTFRESGYPNVDVHVWYGLLGPAGLPIDIANRLNSEINAAIKQQEIRVVFDKAGLNLAGGSAEQFREWLHAEAERWTRVVKEAGIKSD